MTQCTKLLMTVGIVVTFAHSARAEVIEFTKDNPDTLVGTDPGSYEVYGLRLGMTHEEAWKVIHAAGNLMGEKDQFALERIHVYPIGQGGEKGKRVLYLIWETASPHMHELSITRDCAPFLAPNFAKLLTSQSAEKNSEFRMRFLGTGSRDTVDEQAKRSGIDHRVFSHEEIGVQVHTTQALRDRVPPSFAIRLTTPTRQATIS